MPRWAQYVRTTVPSSTTSYMPRPVFRTKVTGDVIISHLLATLHSVKDVGLPTTVQQSTYFRYRPVRHQLHGAPVPSVHGEYVD